MLIQTYGMFNLPLIAAQIVAVAELDQQLKDVLAYNATFLTLFNILLNDVE